MDTNDVMNGTGGTGAEGASREEGGAFGALRSIFRRAAPAPDAAAPAPDGEGAPRTFVPPDFPDKRIVVRNCSTNEMMARLTAALGAKNLEGRYFEPAEQNFRKVFDTAKSMNLYVRWTVLGDLLMLDMMADRGERFGGFHDRRPPMRRPYWRDRGDVRAE